MTVALVSMWVSLIRTFRNAAPMGIWLLKYSAVYSMALALASGKMEAVGQVYSMKLFWAV